MSQAARNLLVRNETLLVHFNGPASQHPEGFPHDLRDAYANPGWKMCFSTICSRDLPFHSDPNSAGMGCVGLIIDLDRSARIISVHGGDAGSNGRMHELALGAVSIAACRDSLLRPEKTHNEWFVQGGRRVGIFTWSDPIVYPGFRPLRRDDVVASYPDYRIFSVEGSRWTEWNRGTARWDSVTYADILA